MYGLSSYLRRHHIGLLALFIALGGTSYAAVSLSANSVGARELKNQAVGSAELKDRSIMKRDLRERLYESLRGGGGGGATGPAGPQGPPGPEGPAEGPAGGVLTGNYPNPGLANGVIGTSQLAQFPAVRVRKASDSQVIPGDGTTTTVSFTDPSSEQYDIGDMFDQATNATELTIPVTGTYVITGAVRWQAKRHRVPQPQPARPAARWATRLVERARQQHGRAARRPARRPAAPARARHHAPVRLDHRALQRRRPRLRRPPASRSSSTPARTRSTCRPPSSGPDSGCPGRPPRL